jgi:putative ABC transport system permease protein
MRAQYFRFFHWHVLRYLRRHPLLGLLNVLSVALGVAVYLATQIANQSANRAFAASVDLVAGKAELEITAPAGHLPETILPQVAAVPGVSAVTPVLQGLVSLPDLPRAYLRLVGIDVFTNGPFRTFDSSNFDAGGFDIERWLARPNSIAVSEEFLRRHYLKVGDKIRAQAGAGIRELEIGFLLRKDDAFDPHFAAIDIGWAQELFDRRGELSTIQLKLINPRERDTTIVALRQFLPKDLRVASPARRTDEVDKMLAGFQLNLTMMSLVSVLVGMFLIYNTVSASVVRRQHEIGILRSLGVTRNEVRSLFLAEAVVLGGIGSFLGLIGGLVLAHTLVGAVSKTISSLYVLVSVRELALRPWSFALAWMIGMGSVVVSAWFPAETAARQDPVEVLHGGTAFQGSAPPWKHVGPATSWLWSGLLCLALAGVLSYLALATGPRWLSFGAAFFVVAGFSFLVPRIMFHFSRAGGAILRRLGPRRRNANIESALAVANLGRALLRNSVTVAALAVAVAMTVGVTVMVFSFRKTVEAWINDTLIADLFVTPGSNAVAGASSFFPPAALEFLSNHPDVETVDTYRQVELSVGAVDINAAVVRGGERRQLQFLRGDRNELMRRFQAEPCVFASEPFARRHHLREGDRIELTTPDGPRPFSIAALFYDYTTEEGFVYLSANNFARFWRDDRINSVAVYLKENHGADEVTRAFQSKFSQDGQFMILSNQSLRRRVFEIFDQTFAVTYVLLAIALFVAITGIFLSLTILITERRRELAVLRAIGASAGQIRKLLLSETAMLGALAAAVGLASGICLAIVLTGVINRAFFGWTIHLAFPWRTLLFTPIWILAAAVIAGVVPAWRASRMALADNLRDE